MALSKTLTIMSNTSEIYEKVSINKLQTEIIKKKEFHIRTLKSETPAIHFEPYSCNYIYEKHKQNNLSVLTV